MPVDLQGNASGPASARTPFRLTGGHVLAVLVGFFVVVASVNGIMMYSAIKTMPGLDAGRNGYDVSQRYNAEIGAARAQEERHWTAEAQLTRTPSGAQALASFADAEGKPVPGLKVDLLLAHPADRRLDREVTLFAMPGGRYGAFVEALPDGVWDVTLVASRDGTRLFQSKARKHI